MSRDVSFSMNTGAGGGRDIIQQMAMPMVVKSAQAIADRAQSISSSITSHPPKLEVSSYVGLPNKRQGTRAVAEIIATDAHTEHQFYSGLQAVRKSIDAGRV